MKKHALPTKTDAKLSFVEVSATIAPVVGDDKASSAVRSAALRLGFTDKEFSEGQVHEILKRLSESPDLLGLAAKRALARRIAAQEDEEEAPPASSGSRTAPPEAGDSVHALALIELLTPALGTDKANEVVMGEMRRARLGEMMTRRQAMGVLDALAVLPGIVGITARFAKARFLLR
jgi:hypothetical protein